MDMGLHPRHNNQRRSISNVKCGESIEVEIEVELFEGKSDSRQFCVLNVQLTEDNSEQNSLESNKVVVWKSQ